MKSPFLTIGLAALFSVPVAAQTPFVHRSGSTYSATTDVNIDSRRDLILYDAPTGLLRFGLQDAAGAVAWTMKETGLPNATGVCVAPAINPNYPQLFLTRPDFNQVRILAFDSSPDIIFSPAGPEPQILAPFPFGGTGQAAGVLTLGATFSGAHSSYASPAWASLWTIGSVSGARLGNPFAFTPGSYPRPAFLLNGPSSTATLRVQYSDSASPGTAYNLTNLPSAAAWTTGLYANRATVFTWQPGLSATLSLTATTEPTAGIFAFGTPASHTLPGNLTAIIPLEATAGSEFAALFSDDTVRLYRFNPASPATAPVLLQNLGTSGGSPLALLPLNGTSFALLRRTANGTESLQRLTWNGTSYQAASLATPPTLRTSPLYSNVLFFQREPLVNPTPGEVHRQRVGDWTTSVVVSGQARQVNTRTDNGPTAGLSTSLTGSIVNNPAGANFALPSQIDSASSLQLLSSNIPGPLPPPQFSPPPGPTETPPPGQPLIVQLTAAPGATIYFEGPGGFAGSLNNTVSLTASGTIRAYARIGSKQSPIVSAAYTFLTPGATNLPAVPDLDSDGVSDGWAALTGATNPSADTDGDGSLNFAEYLASTDPASAASNPGPGTVPALTFDQSNGLQLRWNTTDPAVILQTSPDLQTWTVVTKDLLRLGNLRYFNVPPAAFPKAYWRLRR